VSTTRTYHSRYEHDRFQIQGPLRECRSIQSGVSGLPYYRTLLVCVPDVNSELAVWRHNPKKKNPMPGILVCDPMPRILEIEIPGLGSCSRSANGHGSGRRVAVTDHSFILCLCACTRVSCAPLLAHSSNLPLWRSEPSAPAQLVNVLAQHVRAASCVRLLVFALTPLAAVMVGLAIAFDGRVGGLHLFLPGPR